MQEEKSRNRQTGENTGAPTPFDEASKERTREATKLFLVLHRYKDKMALTMARIKDVTEDMPGDISSEFPRIISDSDTEMGATGGRTKEANPWRRLSRNKNMLHRMQ